jgi:hypothetical protein
LTEPLDTAPISASTLSVRLEPDDRGAHPYVLVPFEVPGGTRAVRVELAYEAAATAAGAGTILDLGLIGPGRTDDPEAFRGWSGSERSLVVVGETAATPGYRPGPITAGTWHVLLGLYRIDPAGTTANLRVEPLPADPPIPGGAAARLPAPAAAVTGAAASPETRERRWIPADLHAHTLHSDGVETVAELAARARGRGLEALFVTDHNTDAHLPDLDPGATPALLPGEEVTTYRGHLNALGIDSWIEFRHTSADGVAAAIAAIHSQGGIASVNHPTSADMPWRHGTALDLDAVEVWNGPWSAEDDAALDWWEAILSGGRRVTAVGGSDTHGPGPGEQPVGTPTTWLLAAGTDRAPLVDAIRSGRVILTRDAATPPPELWVERRGDRAGVGETLATDAGASAPVAHWRLRRGAVTDAGIRERRVRLVVDGVVWDDVEVGDRSGGSLPLAGAERASRVRLEIREPGGELVAATNPVYLEGAGR